MVNERFNGFRDSLILIHIQNFKYERDVYVVSLVYMFLSSLSDLAPITID